MTRIFKLAAVAALALATVQSEKGLALCAAPATMTGVWKGNDGGTYYVRQNGVEVWWLGQSKNGGADWTNVFRGLRDGNVVKGRWVDVPKGGGGGAGTLNLQIFGTKGVTGFKASAQTGGFSGTNWFQPCGDTE